MIFLFDLDGTVTQQETLPIIASHFGVKCKYARKNKENMKCYFKISAKI
mgnify:CR=1 FL=1